MPPPAPPAIGRSSQVLAVVLLGIQAALLAKALAAGDWILDAGGRPLFTDFSTIWVTGLQIRHEPAVAAYDWARHGAWERGWFATEGLPSGWHYAPSLLFVVWALALLPFPLAFAGWVASTGALYALAVQGIVRHRVAGVLALAFPAVTWNAMVGQTGTLTAALIGAALGLLERRPVWAGIALGCLTYKPQFGLLFPLALAAGGHWRATAAAAATAAGLIAASALAFGPRTWLAFAANIPALQSAVLEQNLNGAHKLQSVFGLLRFLGAAPWAAYAVHAAGLAFLAGSVIALWRSRAPYDLKAAWLALATVLATPYAFVYDLGPRRRDRVHDPIRADARRRAVGRAGRRGGVPARPGLPGRAGAERTCGDPAAGRMGGASLARGWSAGGRGPRVRAGLGGGRRRPGTGWSRTVVGRAGAGGVVPLESLSPGPRIIRRGGTRLSTECHSRPAPQHPR